MIGCLVSAYQLIQVIADLSFGNHAYKCMKKYLESTPIGYRPINVKRVAVVQQEARSSRSSGSPPRSKDCFIRIKGNNVLLRPLPAEFATLNCRND